MKKNKLFSSVVFVFSVVLLIVSSAILVHSATTQSTRSTLNVTYVADNVSFTASAFYQLADTGAKVDLVDTSNSNATSVTFTPSANSTTKTLSAVSPVELTVNKQYVLFTYAFTNTATSGGYCIKVSLTDGTTSSSNVDVTYLASDSKYCAGATPTVSELTSFKSSVSSTSAPTNVYIQAQETKYFYILVEIDNPYLDSGYNSTASHGLVWSVENTFVTADPYAELPRSYFTIDNNVITGVASGVTLPDVVVIPSGITGIGDGALYEQNFEEVVLPSSITSIGELAFGGCFNLQKVIINSTTPPTMSMCDIAEMFDSETPILVNAFERFYETNPIIIVPDGALSAYMASSNWNYTNEEFMSGPPSVQHSPQIYASSTLYTDDENGLIYYSDGADKILLRYIGDEQNLTIDATYTGVAVDAFYDNAPTSSITFLSTTPYDDMPALDASVFDGVVLVPNGCGSEYRTAWNYRLSDGAQGVYGLNEINNDNGLLYTVDNGEKTLIRYIGNASSVTLDNTYVEIEIYAFSGCTSLTSVTLGSNITRIIESAFTGCVNLATISLSSSLQVIEAYSFNGCRSLVSVTIPSSVTSIGIYAFYNCSSLTSVTFENTSGWKKDYYWNPTSIDVTNATYNASRLTSGDWGELQRV